MLATLSKPTSLARRLYAAVVAVLCATLLSGCLFSIGLTNSPPPPTVGAGPASDRR